MPSNLENKPDREVCFQVHEHSKVPMTKHLRQRIESCVSTVLELNRHLGYGQINPETILQFERLKVFVEVVSDDSVEELDIGRIEDATRKILVEMKEKLEKSGAIYRFRGQTN